MNQVTSYDPETGEIAPVTAPSQSMVGALVKAEIDTQIATAHAYPRSVSRSIKNILSLVTISQASAEECNYALPRGGKPITGPSVRLAEIVASQWGNCRVGARVVHVDRFEKYVEAEGVFHDLETNMSTTARVRRRITDKNGRLYNDDMIVVTGNAACSIAKRNAILGGIPKAVWNEAYETALRTIKGDVKTLPERRDGAFKAFAAFGITPDQIVAYLGLGGLEDINLDHLSTLIAIHKAIKDGEQTVEDYFSAVPKASDPKAKDDPAADKAGPKGTGDKLADIAKGKKAEGGEARGSTAGQAKAADGKDKSKADKAEREEAAANRAADDREEAQRQHEEDVATRNAETPKDEARPTDGQAQAQEGADAASKGEAEDPEARAYRRGRTAHGKGAPQDAVPPDLKRSEALTESWVQGWKDAAEEAEG